MSNIRDVYELVDISSAKEEEEIEIMTERERTSTPVPKNYQENSRIVLEISHSSTGASADEEENFDISADSLESNCKRVRLDSSLESLGPEDYHKSSDESPHSTMIERPESPDVLENKSRRDADDNLGVFLVESHEPPSTESKTSAVIADFLDQVREDDVSSYFVTPPGPLKKVNVQPISTLHDLEKREYKDAATLMLYSQLRIPGRATISTRAALSQPAPGLACVFNV